MAYVYRHIRLDKDVPFYIGIGSDDEYKRSTTKLGRNKYWNNIINKTPFDVDILVDDIDWDTACNKEKEFIILYKRKKDGGTLCNLTIGGEGQCGMIPWNFGKETPIETRIKQRDKKIGKENLKLRGIKRPGHVIEAVRKACIGRPAWNKGISPSQESINKRKQSMVGKYLTGSDHPMYGTVMPNHVKEALKEANKNRSVWNKGKTGYKVPSANHVKIGVMQYSIDWLFIAEHDSICNAEISTGCGRGNISSCCKNPFLSSKGFRWKYKTAN